MPAKSGAAATRGTRAVLSVVSASSLTLASRPVAMPRHLGQTGSYVQPWPSAGVDLSSPLRRSGYEAVSSASLPRPGGRHAAECDATFGRRGLSATLQAASFTVHMGATGRAARARRTADGCPCAGDAAPHRASHTLGQERSPRSRELVPLDRWTRARWRKAFRRPEPLPPSTITRSFIEALTKDRRNGVNTCSFSVSVSTVKPRNRLSPVIVMPSATTIVAERLPSSTRASSPDAGVRGVSSRWPE